MRKIIFLLVALLLITTNTYAYETSVYNLPEGQEIPTYNSTRNIIPIIDMRLSNEGINNKSTCEKKGSYFKITPEYNGNIVKSANVQIYVENKQKYTYNVNYGYSSLQFLLEREREGLGTFSEDCKNYIFFNLIGKDIYLIYNGEKKEKIGEQNEKIGRIRSVSLSPNGKHYAIYSNFLSNRIPDVELIIDGNKITDNLCKTPYIGFTADSKSYIYACNYQLREIHLDNLARVTKFEINRILSTNTKNIEQANILYIEVRSDINNISNLPGTLSKKLKVLRSKYVSYLIIGKGNLEKAAYFEDTNILKQQELQIIELRDKIQTIDSFLKTVQQKLKK